MFWLLLALGLILAGAGRTLMFDLRNAAESYAAALWSRPESKVYARVSGAMYCGVGIALVIVAGVKLL